VSKYAHAHYALTEQYSCLQIFFRISFPCNVSKADPRGRAVLGTSAVVCWECGLKSIRGQGYLSLESVVCCQVDVSASG